MTNLAKAASLGATILTVVAVAAHADPGHGKYRCWR
jgi:hypothetical protein